MTFRFFNLGIQFKFSWRFILVGMFVAPDAGLYIVPVPCCLFLITR